MIKLVGKVNGARQVFDADLSYDEICDYAEDAFDKIARVYRGRRKYALRTAILTYPISLKSKGKNLYYLEMNQYYRIPFCDDVYLGRTMMLGGNTYINALYFDKQTRCILLSFVTANKSQVLPLRTTSAKERYM